LFVAVEHLKSQTDNAKELLLSGLKQAHADGDVLKWVQEHGPDYLDLYQTQAAAVEALNTEPGAVATAFNAR
jgi:hypothetical protein